MRFGRLVAALVLFFFNLPVSSSLAGMVGEMPPLVVGTLVWSDGFESGDFSAWSEATGNWKVVTSPQSAHSGLRGADIIGPTGPDGDILRRAVSSAGYQDLRWEYWLKVREPLEVNDRLTVEWTPNGLDWETLATYTNQPAADWVFAAFALPATANDNPNLGFRLRADFINVSDRMNFDDFVLSGVVIPEPTTLGFLLVGVLAGACRRRP